MRPAFSVLVPLVLASLLAGVAAAAQGDPAARLGVTRGPRFFLAQASEVRPVLLDVSRTPVLRRHLALALDGVSLKQALAEISRQAGLDLVYGDEVVPRDARVHLVAERITVVAALTDVLLDAGVDVLFKPDGRATLVKRSQMAAWVQSGSITGRVTDANTQQGVAGVRVFLERTRWGTTTDADGRYRLAEVAPGAYTLVARRIGFKVHTEPVTVEAEREVVADVALQSAPTILSEVVVTGTVVPTEVKALPTPITVITAEDIERHHVQRFDEMIRLAVPGAAVWEYGGTSTPVAQDISLRGKSSLLGGSQSNPKVYVDGVEVTSSAIAAVDPHSIERIEVIRGPQAAAIYGSDAMGGVIQMFTKRGVVGRSRPEVEVQAALSGIESAFGSSAFQALGQAYSVALRGGSGGSASYRLGGGFRRTGEWMPEYGAATPNLDGGVRLEQGPLTVDLSSRLLQNYWDEPYDPRFVETGAQFFSTVPSFRRSETRLETQALRLDYQPTEWWQHALTLGLDRQTRENFQTQPRRTFPEDTLLFFLQDHSQKRSVRYHTAITARFGAGVTATMTAGADHYTLDLSILRTNGALRTRPLELAPDQSLRGSRSRITSGGIFGQVQLNVREQLFLTGAVRADAHSNFGDELGMPLSPRVGLAYVRELGATTVKLRAAYGEAMRPPFEGAKEGADFGFFVLLANPELRPERQVGPDMGVDLTFGSRGSLSVTYFNQTAKNFLQLVTLDPGPPEIAQWQNLARVKNTGWEIEGALELGRVALRGNFADTYSRPADLGTFQGDEAVGQQLLGQPRYTGVLTVTASPAQRTSVTAGLTYQGSWTAYDFFAFYRCFGGTGPCRNDDFSLDEYITRYPGFAVLNFSIDQQLTAGLAAYVSVQDLTNRGLGRAQDSFRAVQGRITTVGVRARY